MTNENLTVFDVWIDREYMGEFTTSSRRDAAREALMKYSPNEKPSLIESAIDFVAKVVYKSGYDDPTIVARCIKCSTEFTERQIEAANACPSCGSKSIPMSPKDDVTVKINWHELRVLTIWAENWARQCDKNAENDASHENMLMTIMTIAQRLQRQYSDKTPLTLFSEIRELRKTIEKDGTTIETDLDDDSKLGLS